MTCFTQEAHYTLCRLPWNNGVLGQITQTWEQPPPPPLPPFIARESDLKQDFSSFPAADLTSCLYVQPESNHLCLPTNIKLCLLILTIWCLTKTECPIHKLKQTKKQEVGWCQWITSVSVPSSLPPLSVSLCIIILSAAALLTAFIARARPVTCLASSPPTVENVLLVALIQD